MRIAEALRWGLGQCGSKYVAREILKLCERLSDEQLVLKCSEELAHEAEFRAKIAEFKDGRPLEYITQSCEFMDFKFYVDERVLIPRCETEILVKKALALAQSLGEPRICEIGTGSGIIAICLKKLLPSCRITASDISADALEMARVNASNLGADVEFVHCAYADEIAGEFDLIVSNPPYIANSYALDARVLQEPKQALFGGERGDEILKRIVLIAARRAKFLACEMGYDQKQSLSAFLREQGFRAEFYKDLAQFDRGFVARNLNRS
nr:peptide chain release factor N(5)-glutamine methyltransferase [uncultured Campylobacter sp.]